MSSKRNSGSSRALAWIPIAAALVWFWPVSVAGAPRAQDNPGVGNPLVDTLSVNDDGNSPAGTTSSSQPNAVPKTTPSQKSAPRPECRVTNVFYDTDVREILQAIATQCFVNVIADESVTGILTAELTDLPLEEAMRRVLSPFGLTFRWLDGYYLVGSPRPSNPSFPLITETVLYRPSFIKAGDILKLMSTYYEPFVRIDTETNTATLTGSPEMIARMQEDLAQIDRPPRQVMIEALVTEMSSDVSRQLGISWDLSAVKGSGQGLQIGALPKEATRNDTSLSVIFDRIGIQKSGWIGQYQIRLNALVDEGKAHVRANPRIATVEGNKAQIFIGREEYFSILSGSVSFAYAQLEVIKTGIALTIIPYVSEDGAITLEVSPEVSDVIGSGSTGLPVTNKRSVTTKVRVNDGETVVIGGLLVKNRVEAVRKIPLLGSIPILGHLFRHTTVTLEEKEISILITPRLWAATPEKQ